MSAAFLYTEPVTVARVQPDKGAIAGGTWVVFAVQVGEFILM